MNFLDQQNDFYTKAQDSYTTPVFWSNAFVKTLLNQSYQHMAREVPGGLRQVVSFQKNTAAQPSQAVNLAGLYVPNPNDLPIGAVFDEVRWLQIAATIYLVAASVREASLRFADWNNVTADIPVLYIPHAVQYGNVFLVPQPVTPPTNLIGEVSYQHPTLVNDTDVCAFPAPYHELPVLRALSIALAMEGDSQDLPKAAFWKGLYQEGLAAYVNQVVRSFDATPPRARPRFF